MIISPAYVKVNRKAEDFGKNICVPALRSDNVRVCASGIDKTVFLWYDVGGI